MLNRFFLRLMLLVWLACGAQIATAQFVSEDAVTAVARAQSGNYAQAYDLAGDDPVLSDLVTYLRLRSGGSPFNDYALFLAARPDWRDANRLRARAEEMLFKGRDSTDVIAWFDGHDPQTGQGAVRAGRCAGGHGRLYGGPDCAGWRGCG